MDTSDEETHDLGISSRAQNEKGKIVSRLHIMSIESS
jgi:hypothetical protein